MEIEYDPWSGEEEPQQPPKRATVQAEARKATKTGNQSRKVYIVCAILIALLMGFFILGKTIYKPAKTTPTPSAPTSTSPAPRITYNAIDYEENPDTCKRMYETGDPQLYWSCVQGDLKLGAVSWTGKVKDRPENSRPSLIAPGNGLGPYNDGVIDPEATATCFAETCLVPVTFDNGNKPAYALFSIYDSWAGGVFVPVEDAAQVLTPKVIFSYVPNGNASPDPDIAQATPTRLKIDGKTYVGFLPYAATYCGETTSECQHNREADRSKVTPTGTTHILSPAEVHVTTKSPTSK